MILLTISSMINFLMLMVRWFFLSDFTTTDRPCCGSKDYGDTGCNTSVPLCGYRKSCFFWDRYHPTEAASAITATELFSGNETYVHPVNVQQLVASRP